MPDSVSEHDCMCPSGSDQQQKPSNRLSFLPLAGPCKAAQLNLHTNFLPGSTGFYFLPDNWDIVLFIALQCTQAQQPSAWNAYEFILGCQMHYSRLELSCWHLRQQICFPQLSITPSPHSAISASLLLLANRVGPQAEQVQAAVMVALLTHTHMHGHTQGRRVGCGTTLSEMADQDCLLERRESSVLVVFCGLSREWAGV